MAAVDSQGMHYDDASQTLTVSNLVVTNTLDTTEAGQAGAVAQTKSANYTLA